MYVLKVRCTSESIIPGIRKGQRQAYKRPLSTEESSSTSTASLRKKTITIVSTLGPLILTIMQDWSLLFTFVLLSTAMSAPLSSVNDTVAPPSSGLETATTSFSSILSGTSTFSAIPEYETVPSASNFSNFPAWSQDTTEVVEPILDGLGATIIAPDNEVLDQQNPDLFAPPTTDEGLT